MSTLQTLPLILFIVIVVASLAQRIRVPYPLLLVITGLILGFVPSIPNWLPPTEYILPLFLPPILFSSARLISTQDIRNNIGNIATLSVFLVIVTSIVIGLVLNFLIPEISFSSAFLLGAIISPTDTTAASAILNRMNIRKHIIQAIEVESLFNDAAGIVMYKTGILLLYLGSVNFWDVSKQTVIASTGGILIGLILAKFTRLIVENLLVNAEGEFSIIMSLTLAYSAYLFAEHMGVSGVLATVSAGLVHKKTEQKIDANARLSESNVWAALIFFLNGILFVSIGMQFQSYWEKVRYIPISTLVTFSVFTILTLLLLRILWVAIVQNVGFLFRRKDTEDSFHFTLQKTVILSWSGMRGLVSLALAVALPEILGPMVSFPYRDIIIFITIIVILFTLLVQGLTLPIVAKRLNVGTNNTRELRKISAIHEALTQKALKNIEAPNSKSTKFSENARKLVRNYYANRVMQFTTANKTDTDALILGEEASRLLSSILQYERNELAKMLHESLISQEIYIRILRKIDRDEVGFSSYR